ncbi:hypothetical protein [Isoptericola croceus]|uniref:hypothetical protein n=1 Tax=Isoptericola croceus TaxID=3031406 RepID=UPI0023FA1332|nr:hypothetical protein [Isoptericola croceus]
MKLAEANRLIRDGFREATPAALQSSAVFASVGDKEILDAFLALERAGNQSFVGAGDPTELFLWEAFGRFGQAIYPGVHSAGAEAAPRILEAFKLADGAGSARSARLGASIMKRRVAIEFGYKPVVGWPVTESAALLAEMSEIESALPAPPSGDSALQELENARQMMPGANDELRSTLRFSLPHPLTRRETSVAVEYEGLIARVTIKPSPSPTGGVQFEGAQPADIEDSSPGAWSVGASEIVVVASGLIDWTASVPKYEIGDLPGDESPALGKLSADLVRAVLVSLATKSPDELSGQWLPLPADVKQIHFMVGTVDAPSAYHMTFMPMNSTRITVLDADSIEVDLGSLTAPRPWEAARAYALGALRAGRSFDAVAWANVAIEALIDEKLYELTEMSAADGAAVLTGSSIYSEAEDILAKQFPEMAHKVDWPAVEKAPSRYRQIKAIARVLPIQGNANDLKTAYRNVSDKRNDVMHGRAVDTIAVDVAETAIDNLQAFIGMFGTGD